ncbi:MAG: FAD-dependent oxidoreductase, partial [Ilumatobacter sp.]
MADCPGCARGHGDRRRLAVTLPGRAQVVVVGGGIVGCSIAYHLTRRDVTDVLVLEQGQLTGGTTWHAAGLVSQLKSSHSLTRLATYSARLFEELEEAERILFKLRESTAAA